jgi:DMSO/TMAO reductase YedYZ molybdopterin-dependent catalytic subunit
MSSRRTNVALLWLLVVAVATGVAAFGIGSGWNLWVTSAHGLVGLGLITLVPWKSVIVRRGLARRRPGRAGSIGLTALVLAAVLSGILHSTGAVLGAGPLSTMQIHVGSALMAIPLALWHVRARPARLHRSDLSRRDLLRAGGVLGAGALLYGATRVPSARRSTGSHERGSFRPEAMPVTQWFNDSVPDIVIEDWTLRVGDRVWTYDELLAHDDRVTATLDCTGGWFAEQHWEGAWLDRLLGEAEGRSVEVFSTTGYGRRFPLGDAPHLLLATKVGEAPLSEGHGFPVRLVAPGRRGFWWVKWVTRVAVDDRPWWLQSPFPLT